MNKNVETITSSVNISALVTSNRFNQQWQHDNKDPCDFTLLHHVINPLLFWLRDQNDRNYVLWVWLWNLNTSSTTLRCTIMWVCVCLHVKLLPALSRFRASGRATDGVMVTQGPMPKPQPPRTSKNTHTYTQKGDILGCCVENMALRACLI